MAPDAECKVDRVIAEYGLHDADPRHESIHDGLLARWRGAGDHAETGYRPLTEWFNKRLLRAVWTEHGRETGGGRLEGDYDVLTGDDDLLREELLESLRADGIDASRVRDDVVSWGTMRTHLLECLDGEKAPDPSGDWERDSIRMARSFAREKVAAALSSLASKGELDGVADSEVAVQVHLECRHCPTRVPLAVALDRGVVCDRHAGGVADS